MIKSKPKPKNGGGFETKRVKSTKTKGEAKKAKEASDVVGVPDIPDADSKDRQTLQLDNNGYAEFTETGYKNNQPYVAALQYMENQPGKLVRIFEKMRRDYTVGKVAVSGRFKLIPGIFYETRNGEGAIEVWYATAKTGTVTLTYVGGGEQGRDRARKTMRKDSI